MTLSDSFCVGRYRDEFLDLMRSGTVDIVFANRDEALSLYETDDFEKALKLIAGDCKIAAVTIGKDGAVIVRGNERYVVDAPSDRRARGHDRRRRSFCRWFPLRLYARSCA